MSMYIQQAKNILFNNVGARQTIFKNAFWLTISTIANKLLSLGLIIYAASILGAEGYGQFTFALAFVSVLMIFADFGLSPIVTRDFAHEKQKKEELYSIISLKIVLAVGTFILILVSAFFTAPSTDIMSTIVILALFLLVNSFIALGHSFFHARQKMEYEAWFEVLQSVMILAFGLFALFKFSSPASLSLAYFLAGSIALVVVVLFFHFKIFPLRIEWNITIWKKFLKMSWPLALMGLFGAVYGYMDSIMLGSLGMLEETGWYNAAQKIVLASLVPMGLVGASFYPALSKFSKESKEKFQKTWDYELELMIFFAVPLVVGGFVLASNIISSFYPAEFTPSILAFQILIGTAGFIFLYRPFYDAMVILEQQKKIFLITITGAVINIILNLILIPKYSLYGAAIATVCTHFIVLGIIVLLIKKFTFIQLPILRIALTLTVSVFATTAMYVVLTTMRAYSIPVVVLVLVGAASYFLIFFPARKYILLEYFKKTYA